MGCINGPLEIVKSYRQPAGSEKEIAENGFMGMANLDFMDAKFNTTDIRCRKDMTVVLRFKGFWNEEENTIWGCRGVIRCAAVCTANATSSGAINGFVVKNAPAM